MSCIALLRHLLVLTFCIGSVVPPAVASGWGPADDYYVSRRTPDVDPDQLAAGRPGVVLPSWSRLYLYTVWRSVMLGREGLETHQTQAGALKRVVSMNDEAGWQDTATNSSKEGMRAWVVASAPWAHEKRPELHPGYRDIKDSAASYLVCREDAFGFATSTLKALVSRADANPQRLRAWVSAQDQVFSFCAGGGKDQTYPLPLPSSEVLYWRQLRDYQVAAAHFYNEDFEQSASLFSAIGKVEHHPMRAWGAYLALRSLVRSTSLTTAKESQDARWQEQRLRKVEAAAGRILADSALREVHPATRALLRSSQARFAPIERFAVLSSILAQPTDDPYVEDTLNDWVYLANRLDLFFEMSRSRRSDRKPAQDDFTRLRDQYGFVDWIVTLQDCGLDDDQEARRPDADALARRACTFGFQHAMKQWHKALETRQAGQARAWMLAALMLAADLPPGLESAALQVKEDAPEYLTVRYNLLRLMRSQAAPGQPDWARLRHNAEDMLARPVLVSSRSASARNLFRQERFALADSAQDAIPWLLRERRFAPGQARLLPAGDGLAWINQHLATEDILYLARDARLGKQLQERLAVMAWIRADLLGAEVLANEAARLLAQSQGSLVPQARRFLFARSKLARQHALVLAMLQFDLKAQLSPWELAWESQIKRAEPGCETASAWCHFDKVPPTDFDSAAEQSPAPPATGKRALVQREQAALAQVATATGYVGKHVLQWAKQHPRDADLPWLLHVVVASTRGGCLDAGASSLSRAAWQLLHRRYPDSEWARKTPHWYNASG